MNTRRLIATSIALILVGVTAVALASPAEGKAKKRKPPLKFTLIGKIASAHVVDNDPSGASAGDVLIFSQTLFNRSGDREVGSSRGMCTRTSAPEGDSLCEGSFLLKRGQITIQGVDPPETVTRHPLVVTGGSGRYRGVRGAITVHHVSPVEDRLDFKLKR
jgi:hypothetical protein